MAFAREYNFDGLVGPTHNYAGLSLGNVASQANVNGVSNPREAALQGLAKMKALADSGYAQAVLPPHLRPNLDLLRAAGFGGATAAMLEQAKNVAPQLLAAAYSASPMWTANAATVSPSADTADGRVHFTPANLNNKLHRSMEHAFTARVLRYIFRDPDRFMVHDALPPTPAFGDEGAANHTRFAATHGARGVELFVYGRKEFDNDACTPARFPARQTLEASQAVARLHRLDPRLCVFAQQHPEAIDAGVFHNDVIAVGNGNVLFYHEQAFLDEAATLDQLRQVFAQADLEPHWIRVSSDRIPLADAVSSYLFNSQLLTRGDGAMALVVPQECRENPRVWRCLQEIEGSGGPIKQVQVFDLRQSMRNGGGPACLRLRVALTDAEAAAMNAGVLLTAERYEALVQWVKRFYRDRVEPADLADPRLAVEATEAMAALENIIGMRGLYSIDRK